MTRTEERLNVLVVDDHQAALDEVATLLESVGTNIVQACSGEIALAECDKRLFDVAYIDYDMPSMGGIETGRRLRERQPGIVLNILSRWHYDDYVKQALEAGFDDYIVKDGLSETSLRISLMKAIKLLKLRRRASEETTLAHSNLGLLAHLRHLVGVGNLVIDLAKLIQPFFEWERGVYEKKSVRFRKKFVSAIMLQGEPGSGKSSVIRAIAKAFKSEDHSLPKYLGVSERPSAWVAPLKRKVIDIYSEARRHNKVIVVQADDLVWPSVLGMGDPALSAEWIMYLNTIRDFVDFAARLNNGMEREGWLVKELKGEFKGKILWLFARNRDEDVGEMFGPLQSKLLALRCEFPKQRDLRREILLFRAGSQDVRFHEDALEPILDATMDYTGRDLIGDEESDRGFLPFAIREVTEREEIRYENGIKEESLSWIVTPDILGKWKDCSECIEIERRLSNDKTTAEISSRNTSASVPPEAPERTRPVMDSDATGGALAWPSPFTKIPIDIEMAKMAAAYVVDRLSGRVTVKQKPSSLGRGGFAEAVMLIWIHMFDQGDDDRAHRGGAAVFLYRPKGSETRNGHRAPRSYAKALWCIRKRGDDEYPGNRDLVKNTRSALSVFRGVAADFVSWCTGKGIAIPEISV